MTARTSVRLRVAPANGCIRVETANDASWCLYGATAADASATLYVIARRAGRAATEVVG